MSGTAPLTTRIEFVVELARRLHEYGTAAPRLEAAISLVAQRLDLACDVLSTPTSIVMSFADRARGRRPLAEITQVVRASPGEVNLKRLCIVDEIADRVIDGSLDLVEGYRRLLQIGETPQSRLSRFASVVAYGIASACVAAILLTGWAGVATAAVIGLAIGATSVLAQRRPNIAAAFEAISALVATLAAIFIATHIVPIQVKSVVIASLIVLLPGMSLTTAVRELSSQHLISGTARMAGAMTTLLKLAFGTAAAVQLCTLIGWVPMQTPAPAVPVWLEWVVVPISGLAFAITFRSPLRHYPIVIAAVIVGYICTRAGGAYVSAAFGVFLGGLVLGASSNVFARMFSRPGALIREPGIILLVPGSVGFRTMSFVFERDVLLGLDTGITLMTLLIALVAGLLFGDLLVPPRRKL
ncbi:MAG TPA: threonine/serine exporter family protein [Dokdonella sp.]|uniref:threonine/serine ThrE exporter family protein n=1 Tax=Dokdonella sp. TaxID=2291710 RepID=UPI0025BF72AC|nr:threonine/serine exporter family protein [Dokdonella sp.]HNR91646.1 threonine/serine exporter family protein [Dokdonella sp.]